MNGFPRTEPISSVKKSRSLKCSLKQALQALTFPGFLLLLLGGIAYTVGSILYGLGKRRKWMHSVFHIFVDLGALLQFFCVLFYAI